MSELPPGWARPALGEIAETKLGKMLSAKARNGDGRPYLRNKNVQWGRIDVDDVLRMDFNDEEFERFRLREGDLLVCEGGEVGRAAIWRAPLAECAYQKALHRVRPLGGVYPEYLLYLLMHYAGSRVFDRYVTGSTIAHLPQEDLRELPIPLPPLAEQRRIVAAIEEQLSRLDAALLRVGEAGHRMEVLRRAILQSELAFGWEARPLGDVAETQLGKMLSAKSRTGGRPRPYLRNKNVQWWRIDVSDLLEMDFNEAEAAKFELRNGDVLVCEGGEVGRAAIWRDDVPGCCFQKALHRVRPSGDLSADYLVLALRWLAYRNELAAHVTGSTIAHLPQEDLRRLPIPLPPRGAQDEIATRVQERLGAVARLAAATENAGCRAASLRRSILATAFRGELVPQDPDDEPASVLLERIAAERAAPRSAGRRASRAI